MPNYEIVADIPCKTGECPLWHPEEQALYFTDIPDGKLYRYNPSQASLETVYADVRPIGGFTLQADGSLLLFRDRGNIVSFRHGLIGHSVIDHITELEATRFNDVIADPLGGVFCGTLSSPDLPGRLYRLAPDGTIHLLLEDQGTPNGMGFSPDRQTFYYQDSRKATLWAFDFNHQTAELTNQRALRKAREQGDPGRGDGMTVDADGNLWSGRYEGGCVLKCDPHGTPLETFDLPANNITSLCFAGPELNDLYITSASGPDRPTSGEHAGALFKLKTQAQGTAECRSNIHCE